jgi:hypothetical protein
LSPQHGQTGRSRRSSAVLLGSRHITRHRRQEWRGVTCHRVCRARGGSDEATMATTASRDDCAKSGRGRQQGGERGCGRRVALGSLGQEVEEEKLEAFHAVDRAATAISASAIAIEREVEHRATHRTSLTTLLLLRTLRTISSPPARSKTRTPSGASTRTANSTSSRTAAKGGGASDGVVLGFEE